jgi:hypothetical protein
MISIVKQRDIEHNEFYIYVWLHSHKYYQRNFVLRHLIDTSESLNRDHNRIYLPFTVCGEPQIARLHMVCSFITTHCEYITCIMRSLRRSSCCYWSAVACDGRAAVVEVGWKRYCYKDCWSACSSLVLARWGVLFSEGRWSQRVDLAGSH